MKTFIYELTHELLNNLKLENIKKESKLGKGTA